jgi:hypothetical protein
MSMYAEDPRVAWRDDSSPDGLVCAILDPENDDNHRVVETWGHRCIVRGATCRSASLIDPGDRYGQRLLMFDTTDEAIYAVIGDPQ